MKKSDFKAARLADAYDLNVSKMPDRIKKYSLKAKAEKWMDGNPKAMNLFRDYAQQMMSRQRRFGIGLLTERVRWECKFKWTGEFKISNNHRAYIARRLIEETPELAKYIVLKRVTNE